MCNTLITLKISYDQKSEWVTIEEKGMLGAIHIIPIPRVNHFPRVDASS